MPLPRVWLGNVVAGTLALALGACGSGAEPPVATTVVIDSAALSFTALGDTRQLQLTVTDQRGDPISSPPVTWTTDNAAVADVNSTGLVTAVGTGSTQVTAAAGEASASVSVQVVQTPAQVLKVTGDGQSGPPGAPFASPLTVQVNDSRDHAIAGAAVGFALTQGTALIGSPTTTTGSDGRAATTFTPIATGAQEVTATVTGTSVSATFTETASSGFHIDLHFITTPSAAQSQAFTAAAGRWENLIVGELPDIMVNAPAGSCGPLSPGISQTVDDVLIFVSLESIDGVGGILGAAGPCLIRISDGLSAVGAMRFDEADLDELESNGALGLVILHEMGHVLGFGTLWQNQGLLAEPALSGGLDPHFTGARSIVAFNAAGGQPYSASQKVPVEDMGGEGVADAHWREQVFTNELMTGFLAFGANPLSAITVASLADQGYQVNLFGADSYTLAPALRGVTRVAPLRLGDDVMRMPIGVVGENGRVVEVIER